MTSTLLSTGTAARMLGCSRQHVVDLCESGELPAIRVGTHRRIPSHAVERLRGRPVHENATSRLLHVAVAGKLVTDPDRVLDVARANLAAWDGRHRSDGRTAEHLRTWSSLVDGGVAAVLPSLLDHTDRAADLRSSSPFAGVLDDAERRAVLATARASR